MLNAAVFALIFSDSCGGAGAGALRGGELLTILLPAAAAHKLLCLLLVSFKLVSSRASNEGLRRFHNHGEGPY